MDWLTDTLVILAGAPTLVALLFWASAIYRVAMELRHSRPLSRRRAPAVPEADLAQVMIIVPAHNEAECIEELIDSLLGQRYPKLRVRIALDRCTDETERIVRAAAARDARLDCVTIDACPPEWAGKVYAAYAAATAPGGLQSLADHDWLIFTDADTTFHPDLVRLSVQYSLHRGLKFLSLLPTLRTHRWFERIVQPIAVGQFLQVYPLRLANREGERKRPVATGQFMLFRKDAYLAAGTHERFRRLLLEDLGFARRLHKEGVPMALLPAGPLLSCSMYANYAHFREGWKRIYIDALHWRVQRLRIAARRQRLIGWTLLLAFAANLAALAAGQVEQALASLGLLLGLQVCILALPYLRQGAGLWATLLYPYAALAVARILAEAADDLEAQREITWGGRTYKLQARTGEKPV